MESATLVRYLREDVKRIEEDVKSCTKDIADLKSQRESNNRFLDRLVSIASLLVSIATLAVLFWRGAH